MDRLLTLFTGREKVISAGLQHDTNWYMLIGLMSAVHRTQREAPAGPQEERSFGPVGVS